MRLLVSIVPIYIYQASSSLISIATTDYVWNKCGEGEPT